MFPLSRLVISHRPKLASLPALREAGTTHVVTLCAAREGAEKIGDAARRAGLTWIWWPLDNGDPPPKARDADARGFLAELLALLDGGAGVFLHCSAGIHRTGMIAHALLRQAGHSPERARATLRELRAVTADGVGPARLAWGERLQGG